MVLFVDGEEVANIDVNLPPNVYRVVNVHCNCVAVKLTTPNPSASLTHVSQELHLQLERW